MKTTRPLFWFLLVALSIAAAVFAFRYFGEAFPLVTLDLRMDRETALAQGQTLADRFGWGPEDFVQASSFGLDSGVQNFVELEGGGKPAFARLLEEGLYHPYTWRVRHYREKETTETLIRFTPAGRPWGFRERLPEDQAGTTLQGEAAQTLAEQRAASDWEVDFGSYELVEQSQELRPEGRIDHTLVYEYSRRIIGEGRYRLRLVVSGDRFTELTHFIWIPEDFERRYAEMRSSNDTIGLVGSLAMGLIYILGGCLIGLFFLLRQGWVLWKQALKWGLLVAFLQGLVVLNQLPLAWMGYDTALSRQGFLATQVTGAALQFVILGVLLTLSFIAAETFTRRAFPRHIQLWKSGSKGIANTTPMLGRVVAGYLLVPLFFGYEVVLYFLSNNFLGWWTPSDALLQPDILANYFPWLSAIAISFQAGFWEECLFRAVPLAGAVLLGRRFGKTGLWVVGAMIVQALIFGAGHAPYPTQPAYARVVELIVPSLFFGAIYLAFGLVTVVVLHYVFDVVWFAIPLFVSAAPGIWVDRGLLILLALAPLAVIGWVRLRAGSWSRLAPQALNEAWNPTPAELEPLVNAPQAEIERAMSPVLRKVILAGGAGGILVWALLGRFQTDAPDLAIGKDQALSIARGLMDERGVELPESWQEMVSIQGGAQISDRFIWQTAGQEKYRELAGIYLSRPRWAIRYANFEGPVEARAEEYQVFVAAAGSVPRFVHRIPEAQPGTTVSEEAARAAALAGIEARFQLRSTDLKEISAEPSKLPARLDWTFTFRDQTVELPQGEARVGASLAGDETVDVYRFIQIPEDWEREERNRNSIATIVQIFCGLLLALGGVAGTVTAVVSWSRGRFSLRSFLLFAPLLFAVGVASFFNNWPALGWNLTTAQPLNHQLLALIAVGIISLLFLSLLVALLMGYLGRTIQWGPGSTLGALGLGIALGVVARAAGVVAGLRNVASSPSWASFSALDDFLPWLTPSLGAISGYLVLVAVLLLIGNSMQQLSHGWERRRPLLGGVLVFVGLVQAGLNFESWSGWLLNGLLVGVCLLLCYVFVLRFEPGLIPLAVASYSMLGLVERALDGGYPGAAIHYWLAAIVVAATGFLTWKALVRRGAQT